MSDHCKGAKNELVTLGGRRAPEYWKTLEHRDHGPPSRGEFPGGLPAPGRDDRDDRDGDTTRRDFLTLMGFGAAAASVAACRAPEQKAVPIPVASDEMVPGVPNFYATTCGGCASACSLVVKQRDGRPIKIEGNELSTLFGGATCATGQATVLSLYDEGRLRGPLWKGEPAPWHVVDDQIAEGLAAVRAKQGKVVLVSPTIASPSFRSVVDRWRKAFPGFRHVVYDAISASALRAATAQAFGHAVVPHYAFDRARVIVSIDADFLGTWLSPVEFARQYARGRSAEQPASLHIQFEPTLSVTGGNADQRVPVAPSQLGAVAAALLSRIARRAGESGLASPPDPIDAAVLDGVAGELWQHRGDSLVVTGCNDTAIQLVVHTINRLLGNIGKTVDIDRPSLQRQGDDADFAKLVGEMQAGEIQAVILHGVNPGYDYSDAAGFLAGLAKVDKVGLSISTADRRDETAAAVQAVCPDHHFLESWGDAEPVVGYLSLTQPVIAPLFDTRAAVESLMGWIGEPTTHYALLREFWRSDVMPRVQDARDFDMFWDKTLERGVLELAEVGKVAMPDAPTGGDWRAALTAIQGDTLRAGGEHFELAMYESVAMRDGKNANNPWLLELPDPVTGVTWGNVALIAPSLAGKLGIRDGDVVALGAPGGTVELPIFTQPGQHPRTVSVALGHGRKQAGKAANGVGANVFSLVPSVRGARRLWTDVTVTVTGRREKIADTQRHFSMEGRPIVLETTRAELARGGEKPETQANLWNERLHGDRSWGMTIDLNACTGCSACVVACQAENNVPVIGKDQVQRQRIMHWIRIDRYYSGSEDNPHVVHQPMMCQHCGHAPCETVCPVLATTTSSEGLNQQVYNRCIGTRYCANNCPYKVRRFNWYNYTDNPRFDYNMANPVGRLVLNPDVTVRSRGVMEKCSLCVQRIHVAKNTSARTGEPIKDGQIKTACQQVCPTDAIVFGDLNDTHSRAHQLMHGERAYKVLDDLGTRPNVAYLKKVRHGQAT
ncbi:MAG: 4Fe-4S dicluster domain-containing protein [Deltaproteobacteria bacterium]|nr:MAG: 4Fe-4S dicluster domain-containing protein [Deltaproteobacteria bacterium]